MLEFIGGIVVICIMCIIGIYIYNHIKSNKNTVKSNFTNMSENDLVKTFNKLANSLSGSPNRNIDNIASEMLAVLKEYKCKKIEQFIESTQMLTKNRQHIDEEIVKLDNVISKLKADALNLNKENMTDDDYELGAMYMAQIDDTINLKNDLIKTSEENKNQLDRIDKQIKSFNAKYAIKEGSITNMIIKAKTHKNFSSVDIKLNDLISEFNDKVTDIEVEQKVRAQIANTESDENTDKSPNFIAHKEEYIAKFKNMLNETK